MTVVVASPMEHIQDPIDEPPTPFKGRNPQRGRAKERKNEEIQERGSWTCDPAFDEVMQPRIMEDNRAKRFIAAFQQEGGHRSTMGATTK